jgi:hypothetical protein
MPVLRGLRVVLGDDDLLSLAPGDCHSGAVMSNQSTMLQLYLLTAIHPCEKVPAKTGPLEVLRSRAVTRTP